MGKLLVKFWPQILIFIVVFAFFARLFFPPSIFVTPDFGRTDILHIELAQKYVLSSNLKHLSLPFWETDSGQGYPLFAELSGTFNTINLFLLFSLPFNIAIPITYLLTFLIATYGMFFLLTWLKLNKYPSLFGSFAFTFSAAMILNIPHLNLAQAVSFLPFTLLFFLKYLEKTNLKSAVLVSLFLSQILFSFTQIFVYTVILFFLLGFFNVWQRSKNVVNFCLQFFMVILFTLLLSSIQILPTFELVQHSQRASGIDPSSILNSFPLNPKNLLTFTNPFILGKAANGTYNFINWQKNGIYWENTAYIGFLPLVFSLFAIFLLWLNFIKKKNNIFLIFSVLVLLSILLALGKFSPFHVVFSLPPLNFFRVPARFLIFAQFFLAIIAGYSLNSLNNFLPQKLKQKTLVIILIITILELLYKWWDYHPIGKSEEWLDKPQTAQFIKSSESEQFRVYSVASTLNWNNVFVNKGWKNELANYRFFLNTIDPNTNLFYDIKHFSSYQVLPTRRQVLLHSLINNSIKPKKESIFIDSLAQNILSLYGVKYLVAPLPIENNNYQKIFEVKKDEFKNIVYKDNTSNNLLSFYYNYVNIESISDYLKYFEEKDLRKTVLVENFDGLKSNTEKQVDNSVQIKSTRKNRLSLMVNTKDEGLLVYSDSFYPGWKAKVDSKEVKIYAANINSKAIIVPTGTHNVEFTYFPKWFIVGAFISMISLLIAIKIILRKRD